MKKHDTSPAEPRGGPRHWGRAQRNPIIDPYRWTHKPSEPAFCPQCGAVYRDGRWSWGERPEAAVELTCQACHRTKDNYPAGIVQLTGPQLARLRDQILHLARHQEEAERGEHPLNRILEVREEPESLVIATTDIHLPRRIGEAIQRAYKGGLKTHFDESNYFVRVEWTSPG
jgi:hypothetical protein